MKSLYKALLFSLFLIHPFITYAKPVIYVNQIAFDCNAPKTAVVQLDVKAIGKLPFSLINASGKIAFTGILGAPQVITEWRPGKVFYKADFSTFAKAGKYTLRIKVADALYTSYKFEIGENALAKQTLSAIIHYYNKQRANTPQELTADMNLQLFGSNKTVNMRGGWCDASGDVSKYFSHLAYANYMSPQQIPLVTWSMVSTSDKIPGLLTKWNLKDSLDKEALYGADYMMRALSDDDYFYMIVFSYFDKTRPRAGWWVCWPTALLPTSTNARFAKAGGWPLLHWPVSLNGKKTATLPRSNILMAPNVPSHTSCCIIPNMMTTVKKISLTITAP